jgi:hypothetical protein
MPKTRGQYLKWLYDDNIQIPDRTTYRYKSRQRIEKSLPLLPENDIEDAQNCQYSFNLNQESSYITNFIQPIIELNEIEIKLEKKSKMPTNGTLFSFFIFFSKIEGILNILKHR